MAANRYATADDFAKFGLPAVASENIPTDTVEWALDYASAEIDRMLSWVVPLPIASWEHLLKGWCCILAAYHVLRVRGFNPEGSDKLIVDEYERVMKRLDDISMGRDPLVVDRSQPVNPLRPEVTAPLRVYGAAADNAGLAIGSRGNVGGSSSGF